MVLAVEEVAEVIREPVKAIRNGIGFARLGLGLWIGCRLASWVGLSVWHVDVLSRSSS